MTTQQTIAIKNNVLKCSYICGGITDRTLQELGCTEEIVRELCESKRLRKVPVQIKNPDGTFRKITVYEDMALNKTRPQACLTEWSATLIWEKNRCYLKFKDTAREWFDESSIESYCKKMPTDVASKQRPGMMFYSESGLIGVFFDRRRKGMTEEERSAASQRFQLDKCIVAVSH